MARKPRRDEVDESTVGAYHVWSRVVQQAFLTGYDRRTGRDYSHRKEWIVVRLTALVQMFAVECLDEAVLDNHFHAILRNRPDLAEGWTDDEVARRWLRLKQSELELLAEPTGAEVAEFVQDGKRVAQARRRLSSISWFMAYLKTPVSRMANEESGKAGHFWDDRFGCKRLPDDPSLLACSLYVNLNPIRAGMASRPEEARYTSAYARIQDRRSPDAGRRSAGWLAPVHVDGDGYAGASEGRRPSDQGYLELRFDEYLELLDAMVRAERGGEGPDWPPILERLGIPAWVWATEVGRTSRRFSRQEELVRRNRAN